MRTLIITLLISAFTFAQNSFRAEGQNIIWEKVFQAENTDIVALLDRQPDLQITAFIDNVYRGTCNKAGNTCRSGSGLMKNDCKFDFVVMMNPDHYVVKVTNLKILEKYGPMQARIIANPCEKYFLDNGALRTDDRSYADLGCLDSFLNGIFSAGTQVNSSEALTSNK